MVEVKKNIKIKLNKIVSNFKNTETTYKMDWILFGIIALFLFVSFIYNDLLTTTAHSLNFIETIFKGEPQNFYKINYGFNVAGVWTTVCYDMPIYIFFMIWNFPLWVIKKFVTFDIATNIFSVLWMKSILVIFLGLCCKVMEKICAELKIETKHIKWVLLIFVSSPLIFSSLFMLSQYDIIPIFLILLGLYYYIKNDEKKFIFWFSVALPMKIFPIFIFIPLLLLKEKRVLQIIKKLIYVLLFFILFRFLAHLMPYYSESVSAFNDSMASKLLNSTLFNVNFGNASLFIASYAAVCIFCYWKQIKNQTELNKFAIYIPFVTFITFFTFVSFYPYWIIYLTPYFPILLFQNKKNYKINLLLDMTFSISSITIMAYYYYWCFGAKQISGMLITKIFGTNDLNLLPYNSIAAVIEKLGFSSYMSVFFGAFLVVAIALVIINFPKSNSEKSVIKIERSAIWVRMAIIIPYALLMICCYYIK